MEMTICPWCQSEIMQEEGQEPDRICPVCDNELDGYRTLQFNLGNSEEELEELEELDEDEASYDTGTLTAVVENRPWDDPSSEEVDGELQQYEETVEELLNKQDYVPECSHCHEYMLEAGEQTMSNSQFRSRKSTAQGEAIIEAPFKLTLYICPSCFAAQTFLGDSDRHRVVRILSQDPSIETKKDSLS